MTKASWEIRFSRGAFFIIFSIAERMEEKIMDELTNAISEMGIALTSDVWGVWFLIGAALVFFMQCGFAMVETGFTRAKNAGNIIMKNLMDF